MKIAVLGGSFNPLHNGHVFAARSVLKEFHYDKIFFVPTFIPPHKKVACGVSALRRFEMTRLFCETERHHFFAEDCEIKRGGVSYTIDTLSYFLEKYNENADNLHKIEGKIGLIMGEEIAAEFYKWKNPAEICKIADLIIVPRECDYSNNILNAKNKPGGNYCGDFNKKFSKKDFAFPFKMLKNPVARISSTEIRSRISKNIDFKDLVPPVVYDYIKNNGLYLQDV